MCDHNDQLLDLPENDEEEDVGSRSHLLATRVLDCIWPKKVHKARFFQNGDRFGGANNLLNMPSVWWCGTLIFFFVMISLLRFPTIPWWVTDGMMLFFFGRTSNGTSNTLPRSPEDFRGLQRIYYRFPTPPAQLFSTWL